MMPPRIGVFDSGVGGLTVLAALHRQIPDTDFLYVADSANAPYGERPDEFIVERSRRITRFLIDQGAALVVVACNTATAAAIAALRAEFKVPFVGIEPGVKPALRLSRSRRVGVMATPSTLRSAKFSALLRTHAADAEVRLQPCPGLAEGIERGWLDDPALLGILEACCEPLRREGCDTVVLGCTHYPLLAPQIERLLGSDVRLLDTAQAVARQAARLWGQRIPQGAGTPAPAGQIQAWTNGDPVLLQRMAALCGLGDLAVARLVDI